MKVPTTPSAPPNRPAVRGSRFETELQVRPDDLDMFRHVHSSRYMDYVLAARFDQMQRCYGMAMEEFLELGLGWVIRTAHLEFKRPLGLGERFRVRTWVETIGRTDVTVRFQIEKLPAGKPVCEGWFAYTLIRLESGRAEPIPDWIAARYAI